MKKAVKKLLFLVCFGGLIYLIATLAQKEEVQKKLFQILGEDRYLALMDKIRLCGDLIMWPVDYIRALLP